MYTRDLEQQHRREYCYNGLCIKGTVAALFRGTRLGGSDNTEASGGSSVPKPPNHRHIPLILLVFAQGFL